MEDSSTQERARDVLTRFNFEGLALVYSGARLCIMLFVGQMLQCFSR